MRNPMKRYTTVQYEAMLADPCESDLAKSVRLSLELQEQVALYELKATWCDAHGLPSDAMEHRAYVAQLRRGE